MLVGATILDALSRFPGLKRKQELAIVYLLEGLSVEAAAERSGCSKASLWRWLREEKFLEAFRAARRQLFSEAMDELGDASREAVTALRCILRDSDEPASARVAAARVVLDTVTGIRLDDIESRVVELERLGDGDGKR
ncbi:MAG: helix-turn-helix domain-containing protein [Bryobacteraceae bacterium]